MERVLASSWGQMESGKVGLCPEMIGYIAKGSVNRSWSARCHICKSGYSGSDAWKQHRDHSKNTLEQTSNATFQGNIKKKNFEFVGTIN